MIKINIIKKYYYKKYKNFFQKKIIINKKFILNKNLIIKLNFYEYIRNKLQIFNFKGILLNNKNNNYIILLKFNNNDIIYLYFNLNTFNLINIFKIGKFNIN
ncbi:hypothetical protein PRCDC_API04600 [Plasmodium reichenowi]|uniref:Uncharacterized protein n=1 Tax=Plasmodium reichenowi TaxID=5854 RepID=A0A060S0M9_PLARE|nr:hypothetical protein PRSY57_API04600 [Plasmodium reichenowi]KYO03663.1 hypothetical protein PRSY57_API04600 [Plasmodium reichenowi]CDO67279.1 hypothetical protein PRCDC_API04600 [Plasmodium reichenowi]